MVRHIVIWRLKESAHGNDKATNAGLIRERLEALRGRIPGLLAVEVGTDLSGTPDSGDIVLYSEFADRAALDGYQKHPLHLAAVEFIREARTERRVVDCEAGRGA